MSEPGTYLVTGCAGFIGSKVAEQLLEAGEQVIGVDNLNDDYDNRLKHHRLRRLAKQPKLQFHQLDICDTASLEGLFRDNQFNAVLNLAARAGVRQSLHEPESYLASNTLGCLNLLRLAKQYRVAKFVLASTSSLYVGNSIPFQESMAVLNQGTQSPYGVSKQAAESLTYSYHHLYGLDVSVVRYFTVYGPAGRPDMSVFRFIRWIEQGQPVQLLGDGSQARDFTYIDDAARGTVASLKPCGFEIFNLGAGLKPTSLTELVSQLEAILGKKAVIQELPAHPADFEATWADIDKAKRVLNWAPKVSLATGLQDSVNWYLNNKRLNNELLIG